MTRLGGGNPWAPKDSRLFKGQKRDCSYTEYHLCRGQGMMGVRLSAPGALKASLVLQGTGGCSRALGKLSAYL